MINLKNKKVLITGATGGIGNCLVQKFNDFGSQIIATGTNQEKLDNLQKKFNNIYVEKFKLDEHDKIENFIEKVSQKLNGLDVLINNAGITLDNLSIRLTEENWKKVLDVNLTSTFLMCKFAIKKMLKIKKGKIINITSIAGHIGTPYRSVYSAGKSSLDIISETLNMEVKDFNINVVSIAPGDYLTDISSRRYHSALVKGSPYEKKYSSSLKKMNKNVSKGANPIKIAKLVFKIVNTKNPKKSYISGSALEKFGIILKFILPQRFFEYLVLKLF